VTSTALPPWRRGLAESLKPEALPPIVLYQRLYQAVHSLKGGMEMTDASNTALPVIRDCLEGFRHLAEGSKELAPSAQTALHGLIKDFSLGWDGMKKTLALSAPTSAMDVPLLKPLNAVLLRTDPNVRVDSFAKARLQWAAARGMALWARTQEATLAELESIDSTVENQLLNQGGFLLSRSLSALTPTALKMTDYKVKLCYVAALPQGSAITGWNEAR